MGQLAQSVREHPPKSFPNDTETNPKQCMAIVVRPKHIHNFIAQLPKDYCLIPGNDAIKLVDYQNIYTILLHNYQRTII